MCFGDGSGEGVDDMWFKEEESKQSLKIEFILLVVVSISIASEATFSSSPTT